MARHHLKPLFIATVSTLKTNLNFYNVCVYQIVTLYNLNVSNFYLSIMPQWKWKSLSCVRLCDPMDCAVYGILQDRIVECVAVPFCRESSQTRVQTQVSHIAGRFFTSWATREAQYLNREKIVWLLRHSWMWLSRRRKWDIGTGYSGFPFKMSLFVCFWMYISYIWYFLKSGSWLHTASPFLICFCIL